LNSEGVFKEDRRLPKSVGSGHPGDGLGVPVGEGTRRHRSHPHRARAEGNDETLP